MSYTFQLCENDVEDPKVWAALVKMSGGRTLEIGDEKICGASTCQSIDESIMEYVIPCIKEDLEEESEEEEIKSCCRGTTGCSECVTDTEDEEEEDGCECCGSEKVVENICPGYTMCLDCFKKGVKNNVYGECCSLYDGVNNDHVCCK
jgi:hypothetical protein